jgi:hypothetical protein
MKAKGEVVAATVAAVAVVAAVILVDVSIWEELMHRRPLYHQFHRLS